MENIILYNTEDGKASVKLYAENNTVWLTQAQMAELFNCSTDNVSLHLKNIYKDGELKREATTEQSSVVHTEGSRQVTRVITFYNLDAILAVGFRVRSPRGTQFRKWANSTLKEFLLKGYLLDSDRLKNPDGRPDYFDELLEQIRDIRASEKRFYQKLRDLFALSADYVSTEEDTQHFFAETQNKLIYAVTGKTAADLIISRADAAKPNMALTAWQGTRVRKQDIYIAKNYLSNDEIDSLNRLVSIFLESAELRVKLRKTLTLDYWRSTANKILLDHEVPLLRSHGQYSNAAMKEIVSKEYETFEKRRKRYEATLADKQDLQELETDVKSLQEKKE
uniref:Virulence protein RhuM family n=1 Tax=Caudovirales sp. ctkvU4 TaxID=2826783 RepID=A0A8S5QR60_9CAUD|nr:MAG TPA: virulence protein RhuM family [Caudovirales sp. ctkvU4]